MKKFKITQAHSFLKGFNFPQANLVARTPAPLADISFVKAKYFPDSVSHT